MARIVLVHGAFAGAWAWEPALAGLREAGHEPVPIDLPGAGEDTTPVEDVTLDAYTARICETLGDGEPAVLAGQSMGGMAITQAAARCPAQVLGLVYVAAFCPAAGQSLGDLVAYPEAADDQVQANLIVEGDPPVGRLTPEGHRIAMLGCCTPEQLAWATERLGGQPVAPFGQPVSVPEENREAFTALPRAYILCSRDQAIPPAMQRRMVEERGCEPVIEIETDHWPWVSRTQEFNQALNRIVSELEH
jgi:pimeloyl-ACP methyl ester carboxylesterase